MRTIALLLVAQVSFAQGFLYDAADARSLSMGGAPFAAGAGPASLVLNPASCSIRTGMFTNIGGMVCIRDADFSIAGSTTATPYSTDNHAGGLPQIGFSYSPNSMRWGIGVAVTEPFTMNTEWPSTWTGNSIVNAFDVHALYTSLGFGYRVNRALTLGVAGHIVTGGFSVRRETVASGGVGTTSSSADGSSSSAAFSASVTYAVAPQFSIGAGYASGANIPASGAYSTLTDVGGPAVQASRTFHSMLSLPAVFTVGVDVHPSARFRIDAGVQFAGWSAFAPLVLSFDDSTLGPRRLSMGPTLHNTTALRLGIEFTVTKTFFLRAGIAYSPDALNDDSSAAWFPDANAMHYSAGFGYQFTRNIRFDFGYRGSSYTPRNSTLLSAPPPVIGTFGISQSLVAASIALAFEPTSNPLRAPLPGR